MGDLATFVVASGALTAGVVRYCGIRPATPTHAQRHLFATLFAMGAALVMGAPSVQTQIAPLTSIPYLALLLKNSCSVIAAFSAIVMVVCVTAGPDQASARKQKQCLTAVMVVLILLMTVIFTFSDAAFEADFGVAMRRHTELAACHLAYCTFLGACTGRFVLRLGRYLLRPDVRLLMHHGMVMVSMAAVIGMVLWGWNTVVVVLNHVGGRFTQDPTGISRSLEAASAVLMALGLTLPLWSDWLRRTVARRRAVQAVRRLGPLWRELTGLFPELALSQTDMNERPEIVLYRRVVEIRDGELRLMRYVPSGLLAVLLDAHDDADDHGEMAKVRRDRAELRAAAAALLAAIENFRAGRRQSGEPPNLQASVRGFPDVLAEARWLVRVYRCMRDDAVVAEAVRRVRQGSASPEAPDRP